MYIEIISLINSFFSSPEPKVQGELLVPEGDNLSFFKWRQHWSTPLKLLVDLLQIWSEASLGHSHLSLLLLY